MSTNSSMIVCGKHYDIGHPIVTFADSNGFNAYLAHRSDDPTQVFPSSPAPGLARRATRYRKRHLMGDSTEFSRLRRVVRQVVIHLDGCRDASMCFDVLHNQRGLSVHFMIDGDGTIYQTLDLVHGAFHAAGVNEVAIGIELQNRGDAARYPNYYRSPRPTLTCHVHGVQFLAYDFTAEQYLAAARLNAAITRLFDIPLVAPRTNGRHLWTCMRDPRGYRGFLGHYHISPRKWDPGPWDFGRLFRDIGSGTVFPLGNERDQGFTRNLDDPERLERRATDYYERSEQDVSTYFPVGPLGRSRLWHSGVHLPAEQGDAVTAIARGEIVLAQSVPDREIGSTNFIVIRHRATVRQYPIVFFSLYYHLAWPPTAVPWIERLRLDKNSQAPLDAFDRGEVALLNMPVAAGETIASVGVAGPPGQRAAQIHFSVFAVSEFAERIDSGQWEVVESDGKSRLCEDPRILRAIDRSKGGARPDGALSRRELRNFFRWSRRREILHRLVVRQRVEWTPGDWANELTKAPDFAALTPARRQRLLQEQINPTLWWTARVAKHAGLPVDGVVYVYHPIAFIPWFARLAGETLSTATGIESAARWSGKLTAHGLSVDAEAADAMTDDEDLYSGETSRNLTLEDLVNGYPEPS